MSIKNVRKGLEQFRLPIGDDGNVIIPLDPHGKPDYGAVQRHFRIFEKGWTTEELSIRYAEALKELCEEEGEEEEEAKVTARWIRMMEQKNCVPDGKRRWILATLLSIPAASFGLRPLDPFTKLQEMTALPGKSKKPVNVVAYTTFLRSSWILNHANTAQGLQDDITRRIRKLQYEVLYGNFEEHDQMMRLLCYYHQLDARIACDQRRFTDAIDSMNKAYKIAKLLQSHELQALVLFRRGYVYFENGYTTIAINDFDAAVTFVPLISQPLRGAVQLAAGHGHSFLTQTEEDKTRLLNLLDQAHDNIGPGGIVEGEHFMGFNEDAYLLDRSQALMGSPIAKLRKASEASELISKLDFVSATPRQQIAIMRTEARIYLDKGYHKMAATQALNALNSMFYTWNITVAIATYQLLKESKYGNIKEVTDLGLALLKVQKPELFN